MFNETQMNKVLNKVTKWRTLLAGWQLGTRPKEDPESQAVKDQRELLILLRIEMNALVILLQQSKVFSPEDWIDAVTKEAKIYDEGMENRFPGVSTSDQGLVFDGSRAHEIQKWMGHWKP